MNVKRRKTNVRRSVLYIDKQSFNDITNEIQFIICWSFR